jgi:beta-lactamase regulating signal transducer with metallopeptidase domain
MNAATNLLAPDVLRTLGLALLHFIWQGAAIAVLAAAVTALFRQAAVRYALLVAALILMITAPVITFFTLRDAGRFSSAPTQPIAAAGAIAHSVNLAAQRAAGSVTSSAFTPSWLNLFVELWFAGVLLFSLRTAGGLFLIARLRRRNSIPVSGEVLALCFDMQDRLRITRLIRFCRSLHVDAPAVIGWFRPVVLLPITALSGLSEAQLRAVIAHELAHIRRFDAFFNLLQVAAETLLFYHPAIWWTSKRIRAERENCCDDVALAVCGNPAEYARALAMMEESRVAPALAMAANRGPLAERVARLLGISSRASTLRNAGLLFAVLCIASALLAGNALFGLVRSASAGTRRQDPQASERRDQPIVVSAPRPAPVPAQIAAPAPAAAAVVAPVAASSAYVFADQEAAQNAGKSSYIDGLKAEGYGDLSADELIAMKVQGITAQYIREMKAEGLKPTADELVAMRVQGITPDYIRQMRALKLSSDIDSLIAMKVQGITAEYVDQMRKLGFQPDSDQLVALKVQNVTPEYVHELNEAGIHPDADDLIAMKVQGINADYIRSIRATGINPDKDDWIALKVQGVDANFIKSLQAAGFKPDPDEIIGAKVMGITPEFIEKAKGHGFKNLTLDKLIQLKNAGVLE